MHVLRSIFCIILVLVVQAAAAQASAEQPLRVIAKYGVANTIYTAPCIEQKLINTQPKSAASVEPAGVGRAKLQFTPTDEDEATATITITAGGAATAPGGACISPFQQQIVVAVDKLPTVPAGALEAAFRILIGALVLAVLLENAFALLFNWRMFQEYFVGRAWRTPIMFLTSFAVVHQFDLDLVASVFNAYHGIPTNVPNGTFTKILTAMILSGGSVGINRILVNLNLRTDVPKAVEEQPKVARNEAYVSIEVQAEGAAAGRQIDVDISPVDIPVPDDGTLPATVGTIPFRRKRFWRLLFPNRCRFPASGGFRISTDKAYRISIVDIGSGTRYDMSGNTIGEKEVQKVYRFASGAIVDFVVNIKASSPVPAAFAGSVP
jgi:hypothetical protein